MAPQSLSECPFLDASIFRWDDKAISAVDRPQHAPDPPTVRWFSRLTNHFVFQLSSLPACEETQFHTHELNRLKYEMIFIDLCRKFATWVWHPFIPLALVTQHTVVRPSTLNIMYFDASMA